jgi:hypothetical protein
MKFALAVVLLALAIAGCAHISTLAAGTPDGVTCTEWTAHHPVAGNSTWVLCRDENSQIIEPYGFGSQSALAPIVSAASSIVP